MSATFGVEWQGPSASGRSGPIFSALRRAIGEAGERGKPGSLDRWIARELDADGIPVRLPVGDWWPLAALLAEAEESGALRRSGEGAAKVAGLIRSALRFSRPDGSAAFGPVDPGPGRAELVRSWAGRLADPGLAQLARWWFPSQSDRQQVPAAPPLPAFGSARLPLAVLRADWTGGGDLLAIDARDPQGSAQLELIGRGRRLLGPEWTSGAGPADRARPIHWATGPVADVFEWSQPAASGRLVRTAVLLRGRELALLAEQVERAPSSSSWSIGLAPGVQAAPAAEGGSITLGTGRGGARAFPIALPASGSREGAGSLGLEGGGLTLRQGVEGGRSWLPLLISWRPERNRKPARWSPLTVSEKARVCPPSVAFAARISWGTDETLVIYRSLARPASRAFLGHQTSARFLVGAFGKTGKVEPLATIEE